MQVPVLQIITTFIHDVHAGTELESVTNSRIRNEQMASHVQKTKIISISPNKRCTEMGMPTEPPLFACDPIIDGVYTDPIQEVDYSQG